MTKRRVRWVLLSAAALTLIAGISAWLLSPRDGLLDHATRLTSTQDWNTGRYLTWHYFWLDNRQLLFIRREGNGSLSLHRKSVFPPGAEQAASDLNMSLPAGASIMDISPNREYLSYYVVKKPAAGARGGMAPVSMLLSLKDGKQIKWTGEWLDQACWTPDGKGIVSIQQNPKPTIHITTIGTKNVEVLPLPEMPTPSAVKPRIIPFFMEDSARLVTVENGPIFIPEVAKRLTASQYNFMNTTKLTFSEVDLKQPGKPAHTWSLCVPSDASQGRIYASPQRDHLLWMIYTKDIPLIDTVIQKIYPRYTVRDRYLCRWQISAMDGTQKKDIVHCAFIVNGRTNFTTPQWTPDGKRLSFTYNNALYTIPVP